MIRMIKPVGDSEKANRFVLPDLSCLIRPLKPGSMGRKSLNQVISGSGLPLAAHSIVAVRVRSTTFSCGPMSMLGKPAGSWSSVRENTNMCKLNPDSQKLNRARFIIISTSH